jgi:hypothetical protein
VDIFNLIEGEVYQMGKYRIRVKVGLVECDDAEGDGMKKEGDGDFSMVIDEKDAISIDNCEKSVLLTAYPTIRDAISAHLSEVSKKKRVKKGRQKK